MEKYIVVEHHVLRVFTEIVNQKINEGYTPIGGIALKSVSFYQAMVLGG